MTKDQSAAVSTVRMFLTALERSPHWANERRDMPELAPALKAVLAVADLKVVVVHAVDQTADRTRLIGYAYLRGGDRQRLEAALNETAPDLLEVA